MAQPRRSFFFRKRKDSTKTARLQAGEQERPFQRSPVSWFGRRKKHRNSSMSSPTLANISSSSSSSESQESQEPQATPLFEPNWDDIVPFTAVDLDDDCFSFSTKDDDLQETNKVVGRNRHVTSKSNEVEDSNNGDARNGSSFVAGVQGADKDATSPARLPLSRRILVDIAMAVESLEAKSPEMSPTSNSILRTRGNASLGEAQPDKPSRPRPPIENRHHRRPPLPPNSKPTQPHSNNTWWSSSPKKEIHIADDDDISSCSGITMDSGVASSTFFQHSQNILATLFAQQESVEAIHSTG